MEIYDAKLCKGSQFVHSLGKRVQRFFGWLMVELSCEGFCVERVVKSLLKGW